MAFGTMAVRILAYTALLHQDLLRTSSDPLQPVLPQREK